MIRDLVLGRSRFKDFVASPEGIPTNILTDRLERLIESGLAQQIQVPESPGRKAYQLTPKGEALRPILKAMKEWGLQWEKGTEAKLAKR